jgi:hypothetical protein
MALLLTPAALAQFETAVVLGTVRDPSGQVVPGAGVTLVNLETGIRSETSTGETGDSSSSTSASAAIA